MQLPKRGADEIDEIPAWVAVGTTQVVLVEVVVGPIQATGKFFLLSRFKWLIFAHLPQERIINRLGANCFFPVGDVFRLVDALALGANLDVGDRFEPLVFET